MITARGALPQQSRWYPVPVPVHVPVPVADNCSTDGGLDNKFLLAFFFCIFFVVILLLLYICARYLVRRNPHAQLTTSTGRIIIHVISNSTNYPTTPGLDRSAIAALPTFAARLNSEEECSVCLSAVADGELVRLLPNCKHVFHVGCIDTWLHSHATCPVCRADVVPPVSLPPTPEVCAAPEEASASMEGTSSMWWTRMLSSERQGRRGQGEQVHDIEMQ